MNSRVAHFTLVVAVVGLAALAAPSTAQATSTTATIQPGTVPAGFAPTTTEQARGGRISTDITVVPQDHPCCQYPWKITHVGSAYDTQRGWWDCAPIVDNDGHNATWGCNNSFTVGNNVTGTLTVSDGTISAAVGFSVTRSWTQGQTYSLAPGSDWYGEYEAAAVYSTKKVTEEQQICYLTPPLDCSPDGKYATAYANRFIGWTYRPLRFADD